MAFKLKSGNITSFKKMGSSPVKKAGIFEGEGEDRVRIGESEAKEKEAKGIKITRTAADNPDKKEGEQQKKNLGTEYSKFDADLQNRSNRNIYDPDLFLAMGKTEPLTAKKAEKTIREHENLEGGDPMRTYMIGGKEVSNQEYIDYKKKKPTTTTTIKRGKERVTTMTPAEYRESLKKNKGKTTGTSVTMTAAEYRAHLKKQKSK